MLYRICVLVNVERTLVYDIPYQADGLLRAFIAVRSGDIRYPNFRIQCIVIPFQGFALALPKFRIYHLMNVVKQGWTRNLPLLTSSMMAQACSIAGGNGRDVSVGRPLYLTRSSVPKIKQV
jgi:hypothetical protein